MSCISTEVLRWTSDNDRLIAETWVCQFNFQTNQPTNHSVVFMLPVPRRALDFCGPGMRSTIRCLRNCRLRGESTSISPTSSCWCNACTMPGLWESQSYHSPVHHMTKATCTRREAKTIQCWQTKGSLLNRKISGKENVEVNALFVKLQLPPHVW